jgi:glycosyltransferase involved in cell wall biosynthesis
MEKILSTPCEITKKRSVQVELVRILWVKAGKILPVDTGGKIRSYNLLKHLAARNELTLLTYYDGATDRRYEEEIKEQLGAVCIATGTPESTFGQALNYLKHLPSAAPYAVTKFTSGKVRSLISDWDKQQRFDVLVCDFLSASLNFVRSLQTPVVLFQHNVESALWQRQAKHEANLLKRLAFKVEAAKMTRYERATVRRFDHVIAVSGHDRDLMSSMVDESRISVVPTGVDLAEYGELANKPAAPGDNPVVLFLGSMDWEANIDGVDFFCRDIWPQINAAVPSARFCVVGRNPPPRITARASDSIIVTGRVESVLPYLHQAAVFVVPLRIGGGTRLKIYEAMAAGKAVVSTSIGAEGLDVHHGRDILLAETDEDFVEAVINVLRDVEMRRRLEREAAKLAAQYDWVIIAKRFEEILTLVAEPTTARIKPDRVLSRVIV